MYEKVTIATILTEALLFIKKFHGKTFVIKYGGSAMKDIDLKRKFIEDIVFMALVGINIILVHGGGYLINKMLQKLDLEPKFLKGYRITDEETMEVVEMVLAGKVNKEFVNDIQTQGINALGLCGKDGNLLIAAKKLIEGCDIGFVGEITDVNTNLLEGMVKNSIIPVIAPIARDALGKSYNVNADDVASAISKAINSEKLIFVTDVAGVLSDVNDKDSLFSEMTVNQAMSHVKDGVITGGMIPKVMCCIEAIKNGVNTVHIIDGRIEHSLILEVFTSPGIGTMFTQ